MSVIQTVTLARNPARTLEHARLVLFCAVAATGCSDTSAAGSEQASVEGLGPDSMLGSDSGAPGPTADASTSSVPRTLREAADRAGKLIGVAIEAGALRDDPTYGEVLAREFDYVTPEDAAKWGSLAPSPDAQTWEELDTLLAFSEQHGQAFKGHTFVWHQQTPSWVTEAMSAEELRAALQSHIETTLGRYRGRMRAWDVVNEAVDVDSASGYTESIFWRKLGPSYIEDAFRWARAADPDVLLFYNEVGIERMGRKSDFTYAMLQDLLARGVPIDGIGFQAHASTHRYPSESDLRGNIRRFADLGLSVNVSEADVRTLLMPGDTESRWQAQRLAFQQIVGACVVEPSCEGVTLWGFTDRYTWINDDGGMDDPLIFDRDYVAKPAYAGVLAGLSGLLPVPGENLLANGGFAEGGEGWSATSGTLTVGAALESDGNAACVSGRALERDGIAQGGLVSRLAAGGALSFSARVRLGGAPSATVNATLSVQEEGLPPRELSLATIGATDTGWVELTGYAGVDFEATPTALELSIHGPPAGVELCVADVRLQTLSAP